MLLSFTILQENSITFVNKHGKPVVEEQVILNDNSEARFDVMGRMAYVLDYEKVSIFH